MDSTAAHSDPSPADAYRALWDGVSQPPELRDFLAQQNGLTTQQLGEVLLVDQFMRWQRGTGQPVESYLESFSDAIDDDSVCLDLIYGEFRARTLVGCPADLGDLVSRFPQWATDLRRQFEVADWINRDTIVNLRGKTADNLDTVDGSAFGADHDEEGEFNVAAPLRFDDFRMESVIGKGAMGTVYRAVQLSLNKPVALKVLHVSGPRQRDAVDRFLTEARVVASLRHENIVGVHGIGRTADGMLFLVLDLIEGTNLAKGMADGPLSIAEAARVVRQVARAVGHAHSRGVTHRDLKPGNVLMDGAGRVLLTDFGLARSPELDSSATPRLRHAVGTPGYMAPEQVSSEFAPIGPQTDVFGLGALLYALLTKQPPIAGSSDVERILQTASPQPVPSPRVLRPEIPRSLELICLKCLEKDRRKRFQSAREVEDALQRFMQECTAGQGDGNEAAKTLRQESASRQSIVYRAAGAAAVVLTALVLLWGSFAGPLPFHSGPSNVASMAMPVGVDWTIDVFRNSAIEDRERLTDRPAPVFTGDSIRLLAQWTDPRHAYVFWIGSDASVAQLADGDANDSVAVDRLEIPSSSALGLPILGGPGTEVCVLLLRSELLPDPSLVVQRLSEIEDGMSHISSDVIVDGMELEPEGKVVATNEDLKQLSEPSRAVGTPTPLRSSSAGGALKLSIEQALSDLGQVSFVVLRHSETL